LDFVDWSNNIGAGIEKKSAGSVGSDEHVDKVKHDEAKIE
jgi:hypothetical protein